MRRFGYQGAASIGEAIAALSNLGKDGAALAGGTDLLLKIKQRRLAPREVVGLSRIASLAQAGKNDGRVRIGSLVKMAELEKAAFFREVTPLISRAAGYLGSPQIRALATVGGNLCNAAPSAEIAPSLLALDAEVELEGPNGLRRVALDKFFTGPGSTVLEPGEILTSVEVEGEAARQPAAYLRFTRRAATDIAVASVAARLDIDRATGAVREARLALGAVAPTPVRALAAEDVLVGRRLDQETIREAAETAATRCCLPISDLRASAPYRRELVRVLVCRALEEISGPHLGRERS